MLNDEKNLVSPGTGGKMSLKWELEEVEFRKEKFKVWYPFYECEDTGNRFTTTESDGVWCRQMRNLYCQKYGIPYVDEIVDLRKRYGLSAQKMSLILGFGENQWRKYEQEEIPSVSNGRMIRSVMNPEVMLEMVKCSKTLLGDDYTKISAHVREEIYKSEKRHEEEWLTGRLFSTSRGADNGFAPLSIHRLKNLLLHVLEHCGEVGKTKMNKLLFYIDFFAYRNTGRSISGLSYYAIDYGPVPDGFNKVYCEFSEIEQDCVMVGEYESNVLHTQANADLSVFSEAEIQLIDFVCDKFGSATARDLTQLSHEEKAWKDHLKGRIPFEDAFSLKNI